MTAIVLASGSAYRAELLQKLQLDFISCASHVDESPLAGEAAADLAMRLAEAKATALAKRFPQHLIIGSDQVAVCDGWFLAKPGNRANAILQLQQQSGKAVDFYTSVCVLDSATGLCHSDLDVCTVHFKALRLAQIENYVDKDQPFACAGSFKSEGLGIALFTQISGSDPNALVGLPLLKLIALLNKFGVEII